MIDLPVLIYRDILNKFFIVKINRGEFANESFTIERNGGTRRS